MDNIVYKSVVHKATICGLLCMFTTMGMAQLKADFTMDVPGGGCSPLSVAFINTSTGTSASTTYEWDFGNGSNKGHDKDAGSAYITEKKYNVTLTVTDGAQTSTIQKTVTVYKKPTIDFSINTLRGCAPFLVDFSATATAGDGSISKYLWDFGDGKVDSTSNTAKVSHTYESAAKPPVSVTVVNSYGCYVSTDRSGIVVLPPVTAAFSAPKATLCTTAESVSFTNGSTGPGTLTYSWNFGDGQNASDTQPVHPYTEKGSYDVTLIATSSEGCTDTLLEPDFVNVANFNTDFELPAVVCTNGQTVFTNKSTPETSSTVWEIKGVSGSYSGQTFSHTFSTPKKYTIKMTNTYGACKESVEKEIEVKSGPVLKGFVVDLNGACGAPVTVEFNDTSSTSVKWQWNFGNGDTASTKEPSYTYNTDGSFSVLLTATDAGGCVNKVSQTIKLLKPEVKVNTSGPNSGCPGFKMSFAADNAADIKTYQWIFGDGDTSTAARPSHVFNKVGDYTVTLNYVTKTDCAGKVTYGPVSVFTKPVADFSVESGEVCGASPVTFTNLTTGNAGDWLWDFGDDAGGDVSSEPTHYYNQDGNYNVTLIVGNGACKDTVTKSGFIKVLPPFPSILPRQQTCTSGEVIFNQDNTTNKATKMWWDFGDGVVQEISSSQQSTTHVYDKTGRYQAYLIAERGQCTVKDSVFFDVLLEQKPQLAATLTTVCGSGDLKVTISGLEKNPYYPDENNNHYTIQAWQYGDGTTFTPTYVSADNYFVAGYNATLTNLDNGKKNIRVIIRSTTYPYCTDTSNYISLIVKGPKAAFDFTQNNVCYEKPIIFKDKSVADKDVSIKKWTWNFGDDSTVMYTDLTYPKNGITEHAYSEPGYYYAVLTVTDEDGCTSATPAYSPNYASARGPKAAFSYAPEKIFPNTTVFFNNNSNASNSSPQYTWKFSNGTTYANTYQPPSKTYTALGSETIQLIAKDPSGCTDTVTQTLYIKDVAASFTYSETYINNTTCPPVIVKFTNASENAQKIFWDFGDGGTSDNQDVPSHTYYKAGVYRVVLYAYGNTTYIDSSVEYLTIKGPYAILKADTLSGCLSQQVVLSAAVKNAASYTWDFGDGTLQLTNDTFAVHSYESAGIYAPALIMKDGDGCSGTSVLPDKIVIDSLAILSIQTNPLHICDSAMVQFEPEVKSVAADQLQKTLKYEWSFGTGNPGAVSGDNPASFFYSKPGIYLAKLKITSPYGCVKEAVDSVTVLQTPKARILAPVAICINDSALFKGSADIRGALNWSWNFNNGNLADVQNPATQFYPTTGTHETRLIVENSGCFDTVIHTLAVNGLPEINLTPKQTTVCLGKDVELKAFGGVKYAWTPASGLNNTNTASVVATPGNDINYMVAVTNAAGCSSLDSVSIHVAKPFTITVVPDTFVCAGNAVQLPVTGANAYQWINNTSGLSNTSSDSPLAKPLSNTTYTIVGSDQFGCFTDTKDVRVDIKPLPTVKAPDDMELLTGSTISLPATASNDVVRYNWTPSDYLDCTTCRQPESTPRSNIDYIVGVQTAFGCQSSDTVSIRLICAQSKVYIPNAFTPNGDRLNDIFYVKGKGIRSIKSMRVYNRWGETVYETFNCNIEDPTRGWDGTYKGGIGESAVYVYIIQFICDTGETFTKKGTITLIQ